VLDARGDRAEAIAAVERLVGEHPDFRAGWTKLAEWFEFDEESAEKYRGAAEALVQIAPQEAYVWRHLGDARARLKDEAGAKEAFERAVELEPGYEYCANSLIDMAIDKGDYAEADRWLEHVMERDPTPFALARHVRACTLRQFFDQAVPSLERLCRVDINGNDWPLTASVELFNVPQARKLARRVLSEALGDEEAIPAVFTAWVVLCAAGDEWPECELALKRHRERRPHWLLGAQKLLSIYGDRELGERALKFVNGERDALYAEDDTWGEAAYALFAGGYDEKAVRWSAEWQTREGRRPWMMISMAEARFMLDDFDGALAVYRDACALRPDPSISAHHLGVAFCEAVRGNWPEAKQELEQVVVDQLTKDHAQLNTVVAAYAEAMAALDSPPNLGWWNALWQQRRLAKVTSEARAALAGSRIGRRVALLVEHRSAVDLGNKLYAYWVETMKLRKDRVKE